MVRGEATSVHMEAVSGGPRWGLKYFKLSEIWVHLAASLLFISVLSFLSFLSLCLSFLLSSSAIPLFFDLPTSVMCSVMEMVITCDLTLHKTFSILIQCSRLAWVGGVGLGLPVLMWYNWLCDLESRALFYENKRLNNNSARCYHLTSHHFKC